MSIMILQSSGIQGKKIKAGGNDENHDDLEAAVCHHVLEEASEDILLEIFIRLPDCLRAIRTGIVCHSWHSLISQHPQFIPRFISHHHQHQDRYLPPPYTIIFRKAEKNRFAGVQYLQPICKLFSEESMLCTRTNFLEFLPSPMVIRGSCKDLLLVSPGSSLSTDFYICNPITKQFLQLPEIPRLHDRPCRVTGHALVCLPGPTNKFRFKVVEFQPPIYPELDHITIQPINVYCSKSRKWEMISFHYPRAKTSYTVKSMHAVACNGILYWLEYEFQPERVFSLDLSLDDLSNCQLGVIDLPNCCIFDFQKSRVQIGGVHVRGEDLVELRFLHVVLGTERAVDLKVWKLNNNTTDKDNWVLVHDRNMLKWPKNDSKGKQLLAPFFHPTKGDVVFMVWGQKVFQYNLEDTKTTCEMIDELQEPLILNNSRLYPIVDQLLSFPMVHPTWPSDLADSVS